MSLAQRSGRSRARICGALATLAWATVAAAAWAGQQTSGGEQPPLTEAGTQTEADVVPETETETEAGAEAKVAAETAAEAEAIEEIVVTGDLGALPGRAMRSVFGFGKSVLETPRSASSVSDEMMSRFVIRDIDELIAMVPGSFTQSFFGVAGSLEIRGTPGETYFRGMRRLDNPGNYPTPLAASARIDIVRGPPSPIHGPAKIGGYVDISPKSARLDGAYGQSYGSVGLEWGSWAKQVGTAEVSGLARMAGRPLGYHLYAELEDSGSYYRHGATGQTILQASFDAAAGPAVVSFGGMYHDFEGQENAGWNRLTQELVDHGIYVTGSPPPLDANGDSYISHQEYDLDGDGYTDLSPYAAGLRPGASADFIPAAGPAGECRIGAVPVYGCRPELMALANPGQTRIGGDQVLVAPDDRQDSEVITLYFDTAFERSGAWEWRNRMFFEAYRVVTEAAYGFSQFHDSRVFENKLVASRSMAGDDFSVSLQVSPSIRLTRFEHASDYSNEYFDRRDLTRPSGPLDRRLLSTQIHDDYTEYYVGDYQDFGFAVMADLDWRRVNAVLGARYDHLRLASRQPLDKLLLPSSNNFCPDASCVALEAGDEVGGVSWTASLSYDAGAGLRPYATASVQSTVIAGQGAEITTSNIARGEAFDQSRLKELGLKGSLLDDRLYFAWAWYEQERTDFSAQAIVTNQASRTTGREFELRWTVTGRLLISLGHSDIEVVNLNTLEDGGRFSYIGADDVPGAAPGALYGGALTGQVVPEPLDARRAGVPEDILTLAATYDFGGGLAASLSLVDVDSTRSGFSGSVTLPAYTLVNAGVVYERGGWLMSAAVKNATDERYFRSNFPNLYGGVIVLPELPRHYALRIQYEF